MRLLNANKRILTALALGLCAAVLNILLLPIFPVPLGYMFIYLAAASLGPLGGLVSVAIGGVFPTMLMADHLEGFRIMLVALAIGYNSQHRAMIPNYVPVAALWVLGFLPALLWMLSGEAAMTLWSNERIVLLACSEISMVILSGAVLLSPTVSGNLSGVSKRLEIDSLFSHFFAILGLVMLLAACTAVQLASGITLDRLICTDKVLMWSGLSALLATLCVPFVFARRAAGLLHSNFHEILAADLSFTNKNVGFSGLSSEHWRRQTNTERATSKSWSHDQGATIPEPKLNTVIERFGQGICALGRDGTIRFVNRMFLRMNGIATDDVIGKRIDTIGLDPELTHRMSELVERSAERGPQAVEVRIQQIPDRLQFFEISSHLPEARPDSDVEFGADSIIITIKDISERRTIESHLLRAQKLGSLGKLITGIAHSFNNSLTAIQGEASVIRQDTKDQALVARGIDSIMKVSNNAASMIRELLDYVEDGPTAMHTDSLGAVIEKQLNLLQKLVGEDCQIKFNKPEQALWVKCDGNMIMQAVTNLLLNAREAYERGGEIQIVLDTETIDESASGLHIGARPGTFSRLQVTDYGNGMNREVLAKAFDPLFTTKSSYGNVGLGLSIVYAIVRAHDGFLTAQSHPGKGTTIALYLPMQSAPAQHRAVTVVESNGAEDAAELLGNKEKILVVEDEPTVRELVASMLDGLGYDVMSCANVSQALEYSAKNPVDLLLVDMVMPRMRGTELIAKIREQRQDVKSLVMTGYGANSEEISGQAVIHKPFDVDTLAKAVKSALS